MIRLLPSLALLISAGILNAQSLSPTVIAAAGGSGTTGGVTLDWTVGEVAVATLDNGTNILTQGFHQADPVKIKLNVRNLLQGPYSSVSGLMNDGLRSGGYLPLSEPYSALGYSQVGGGGESTEASVLAVTGNDAIVDWIFLELRDKNDNTNVLATRCALVQRDGDVVDVDGTSPVGFQVPADDYYISVQHRNHLSVLTFNTIALSSTPVAVDLTDGSTATYGTDAQHVASGTYMSWSGNTVDDAQVKYAGASNDRDPILVAIGGTIPTNTVTGYLPTDVNMDGTVKYAGAANDRDPILVNIGGTVPTAVRVEQMP
ncbi:MAG: hemagglutinin protein [Flavobacteriales bacterium]|nr:hemagglutinin protein [Flavobacteriales bacterium]MCB9166247.1 hemagglutinin protein [Flavobacteriales bacterium]